MFSKFGKQTGRGGDRKSKDYHRRNLTDGERFEVAVLLKDALAEIGREKMSEARKEAWVEKKEGLLLNNKPSQSEPAKKETKHDTRKEIASNLGWSKGMDRVCLSIHATDCTKKDASV